MVRAEKKKPTVKQEPEAKVDRKALMDDYEDKKDKLSFREKQKFIRGLKLEKLAVLIREKGEELVDDGFIESLEELNVEINHLYHQEKLMRAMRQTVPPEIEALEPIFAKKLVDEIEQLIADIDVEAVEEEDVESIEEQIEKS